MKYFTIIFSIINFCLLLNNYKKILIQDNYLLISCIIIQDSVVTI